MVPFFDGPPSLLNKPDGSVLFECMVNANPPPEVKWMFKGKELSGDRYIMKAKKMVGKYACTLQIKGPTPQDQGIYTVVATNKDGSSEKEQNYVAQCVANQVYKD